MALPAPPPEDRMLSGQVVADYPIVLRTLYAWQKAGLIHVWKFGRKNIYSRREIEAHLVERRAS